MTFVQHGADDPMVAGFIARVAALRPAEWDRLGGACACGAVPAARPTESRVFRAIDDALHRLGRVGHAPGWAWRGVGPFRLPGEVIGRPYVTSFARTRVLGALGAVQGRDVLTPEALWRCYSYVGRVVPWESLPGAPRGPWAHATR